MLQYMIFFFKIFFNVLSGNTILILLKVMFACIFFFYKKYGNIKKAEKLFLYYLLLSLKIFL